MSESPSSQSPFDAFYGLEIIAIDEQGSRARLEIRPEHLQPTGIVHGGIYASIAEAIASMGTNHHVANSGQVALGIANSTNFLRPVSSGFLQATAVPLHRGRTTWVWDVDIRDDEGRRCAVSRVTLAIRAGHGRNS